MSGVTVLGGLFALGSLHIEEFGYSVPCSGEPHLPPRDPVREARLNLMAAHAFAPPGVALRALDEFDRQHGIRDEPAPLDDNAGIPTGVET